ncbi:MAG: Excinuclease ABC C subunit domain protein [Candidatus Roizmanbacteria bacterium GW2011_GWA2_35_19]|uniref:Excinuclease ABC C subunit domain protein n=2 Tax=Candidatus Roizmaniibacteriota TaxID=1752723 RepID=A0A0G0EAH7_9BACT|nr:MAG: Excinuclease ABC C subunit domain protein [Candidatus Roizmanbacteria bacterium GW2011_GWA2_35_19]
MSNNYYVYIITNYENTVLYTGITNDLQKRIEEHKKNVSNNAFSNKYRLYKLVWFEEFNSPDEAILIEKRIKGWIRKKNRSYQK